MKKRKYSAPCVTFICVPEVQMQTASADTHIMETPADPDGEVLSRESDSYVPTPSSVWDD